MKETRKTVAQPYVRISYPAFEDESAPDHAREMNAFFLSLVDAVSAAAQEIGKRRTDGVRTLTADYKTVTAGKQITVEYRIAIRRRGRIECSKTLIYTWEDGVLIPPLRKKKARPKFSGLLTRRRR